jgi:uncharacterized membrane protein YdbT with pleckstrin-like domain
MTDTTDQFRSSTLGWLRGTLAGWGTVVLGLAGAVGLVLAGGGMITAPPYVPLLLVVLSIGIIAWVWISNLATRYELTPDRLILRKGIFVKSIDEIELYRVKNVRLDFSLINQLAGIGTITIESSDETTRTAPLVMRYIERAPARREGLRGLVEAARQKRRVREVDIMHEDI